jgi:thiosulfate reductase cytochrome b subunit
MYKPVQFQWLASVLGGYDGARVVHFASLVSLALFTLGHLVMVLVHPRTIVSMVTGGRREH